MSEIDGSLFTWYKGKGQADASTLGWPPGHWPKSITVRSPRTDAVRCFIRSHYLGPEIDGTGDAQGAEYSSLEWKSGFGSLGEFEIITLNVWNS